MFFDIISSAELFDAEMDAVVATHNAKQEKLAKQSKKLQVGKFIQDLLKEKVN